MKKIFLVTLFAVMSAFSAISSENNSNAMALDEQQCVSVGNVSGRLVEIEPGRMYAQFDNCNSFMVTVYWEVYAYNSNGNRIIIASGTEVCKTAGQSVSKSYAFSTKGYSGISLKMKVVKCN